MKEQVNMEKVRFVARLLVEAAKIQLAEQKRKSIDERKN